MIALALAWVSRKAWALACVLWSREMQGTLRGDSRRELRLLVLSKSIRRVA